MPDIINNGQNGTVYLVCRNNHNQLPQGYQAVVTEVRNNGGTVGNYELLPGRKVQVNAAQFIVAATPNNLVTGPRLVGGEVAQNIWDA